MVFDGVDDGFSIVLWWKSMVFDGIGIGKCWVFGFYGGNYFEFLMELMMVGNRLFLFGYPAETLVKTMIP